MIKYVLCIRDIEANYYWNPVIAIHPMAEIRSFGDACKDKSTDIGKHPEHYELWHLGTFNDDNGTFDLFKAEDRKQLAHGNQFHN